MRTMVDSTNINDEPAADLVAYYCDGLYAVSEAAVRARFPNAIPVPISAVGTNAGVVGDVEPGCMTPTQFAYWVRGRRAAGVDPTGYVNDSNWAAARAALAAIGEPQTHWWEAHYDGIPVLSPGTVAKQDLNAAMTGGHFDKSVVADFWPGVDNVFGPGGGSLGDHLDPNNPYDAAAVAGIRFIQFGLFYAEDAPVLADGWDPKPFAKLVGAKLRAAAATVAGIALTAAQQQELQEAHDGVQKLLAAPPPVATLSQAQIDQLTQIVADAHTAAGLVPNVAAIKARIEKDLAP